MKIGIVGCGFVGARQAYPWCSTAPRSELVLIDLNVKLAQAQAEDILHATPFSSPTRITAGGYEDLIGAKIAVLACGVGQKARRRPDFSTFKRNHLVFEQVVPKVLKYAPDSILLVASNPVDIINQIVTKISKLPPSRVIGSGTILDTARFRSLTADHVGVAPNPSTPACWANTEIQRCWSGRRRRWAEFRSMNLRPSAAAPITAEVKLKIDDGVRRAAYRIIEGKSASYYGIGAGLARIVQAIRDDERSVLTVSAVTSGMSGFDGVSLSLPRVLGNTGIVATLTPGLADEERKALEKSAAVIKQAAGELGF